MLARSAILTLKITFKPHNFADNNFGFSNEVTLTSAFDTKGTPGLKLPYLHSTKDFEGMVQGDEKTGQKGTNSMFVMNHNEMRKAYAEKQKFT